MRAAPVILAAGLLLAPATAQEAPVADASSAWWQATRIGLRVSFGLYSLAEGRWRGAAIDGQPEALRDAARVPATDYARLVERFRAHGFDAREWTRIAKDAGAGYVVFPAKSRDGFCLFRSAHTQFDVLESPHERDMLGVFARACREEGIRLGVAYSIADLQHDDYLPRRAWDPRSTAGTDFARYTAYVQAQLGELIDGYAPALVQFYGAEVSWTAAHRRDVRSFLRTRVSNVLVLDEADAAGATMDAMVVERWPPAGAQPWVLACDVDAGTTDDVAVGALCQAASRGGRLLLHVHADARGSFSASAVGRLRILGEWLRCNGEAVRGAEPSSWTLPFGVCSWRPRAGDTRLYLHVLQAPPDGELLLPDLDSEPYAAVVLGGDRVQVARRGKAIVVRLPANAGRVPVVALDVHGAFRPR